MSASASESSPNTFTSIGVGAPSRSPIMSCSSWMNSISRLGRRVGQLVAQVADDFFRRAAVAARLEPDEDVALVLLRGEQASSDPVRRVKAAMSGVCCSTRFDLASAGVGLLEGAAGGRQVVDDEAALVRFGQKAGAQPAEQQPRRATASSSATTTPSDRPPHRRVERARYTRSSLPACCRAHRRSPRGSRRFAAAIAASSGISVSAWTSEMSTAAASVIDSALEELTDDAREHAERHEHDDRRQRRADDRRHDLAHRQRTACAGRLAGVEMPVDVLDDDDRVVDDQSDRDRQAAHRHDVDRLTQPPHDQERRHDRERQRHRCDERQSPVAQEHQQDDDGEERCR